MSTYTRPDISSIDLSSADQDYTKPSIDNVDFPAASSDIEGTISADLLFLASFIEGDPIGELSANLDFSAEFTSYFSNIGAVSAVLGFGANIKGFQDWLAVLEPQLLQEFYTLTITGDPDIVVKISSWQATANSDGKLDYLQAVIPAAFGLIDQIAARQDAEIIINKGYRFTNEVELVDEFIRANFESFQYDRGPINFTCTVSGYSNSGSPQSGERELKQIRAISLRNGKYRVRSAIDLFLRPGMNAVANGQLFKVGTINYYVAGNDRFCEVSQA